MIVSSQPIKTSQETIESLPPLYRAVIEVLIEKGRVIVEKEEEQHASQ